MDSKKQNKVFVDNVVVAALFCLVLFSCTHSCFKLNHPSSYIITKITFSGMSFNDSFYYIFQLRIVVRSRFNYIILLLYNDYITIDMLYNYVIFLVL